VYYQYFQQPSSDHQPGQPDTDLQNNTEQLARDGQNIEEAAGGDDPEKQEVEEEKLFRAILGYRELISPAMKASAISNGLYNIIPSSAKINIRLQGLDGFRFGDLFSVNNILPYPYNENCIFMLTGYEHTIGSDGWFTDIGATLIASAPRSEGLDNRWRSKGSLPEVGAGGMVEGSQVQRDYLEATGQTTGDT
tara:strand:- start:240 stop:818 length:579 start_codon:yes stop_codon:yes gene_type:complete